MKKFLLTCTCLFAFFGAFSQIELLKDISPGAFSSSLANFHVMDGELFFYTSQADLWKCNGTKGGTKLLKGLPNSRSLFQRQIVSLKGIVYFLLSDPIYGPEIWCYDKKLDKTYLLKDIFTGSNSGFSPTKLTVFNDSLYFIAYDFVKYYQVWRSDGTAAGTVRISNFSSHGQTALPLELYNVNGRLLALFADLSNSSSYEFQLYLFDQTTGNFNLIKSFVNRSYLYPNNFISIGDKALFTVDDGVNGNELWVTDFTGAGTNMVKDISMNANNSNPRFMCSYNGKCYFNAYDDNFLGYQLWSTDGTEQGTKRIEIEIGVNNVYPSSLTSFNGRLYFGYYSGGKFQLAYLDKDEKVHKINYKDGSFLINIALGFLEVKDRLMYFGNDNDKVQGLFEVMDDTVILVHSFGVTNQNQLLPNSCVVIDNELFFDAYNLENGRELWRSRFYAPGNKMFTFDHFIYPNPVDSEIRILPRFFEFNLSSVDAEIFDGLGNSVLKQQGLDNENRSIDVSTLGSGVYVIVLYLKSGQRLMERFVRL